MKKLINKILKFRRTVSFVYAEKTITDTWIWFGKIKFSTYKTI